MICIMGKLSLCVQVVMSRNVWMGTKGSHSWAERCLWRWRGVRRSGPWSTGEGGGQTVESSRDPRDSGLGEAEAAGHRILSFILLASKCCGIFWRQFCGIPNLETPSASPWVCLLKFTVETTSSYRLSLNLPQSGRAFFSQG